MSDAREIILKTRQKSQPRSPVRAAARDRDPPSKLSRPGLHRTFAARIKLWAEGLEPNDARRIAPDVGPPRKALAMCLLISTTTRRSALRSTRGRCAPGWT